MALVNTTKAFYREIQIAVSQGGTPTATHTHSILDAISGVYPAMSDPDFALLTEVQAQARYTAFLNYLFGLYPGFSAANITNQPIFTDPLNCSV